MPLAPIRQTGGWKLAYADFLTALCALFLVLWLVHGATPEQKESVAEQFGAAPSLSAMSLVPERHEPARADQLAATLKSSPLFDQNLTYVSLQKLENGVRIELMDLDRAPLFEKGSPLLNPRGKDLIAMTASALSLVDYGVSIEAIPTVIRSTGWAIPTGTSRQIVPMPRAGRCLLKGSTLRAFAAWRASPIPVRWMMRPPACLKTGA